MSKCSCKCVLTLPMSQYGTNLPNEPRIAAARERKEVVIVPKYTRNTGKTWTGKEVRQLRDLASENTPTRVIGLKLGRTEDAVRTRASSENISLKPTNQKPYGTK